MVPSVLTVLLYTQGNDPKRHFPFRNIQETAMVSIWLISSQEGVIYAGGSSKRVLGRPGARGAEPSGTRLYDLPTCRLSVIVGSMKTKTTTVRQEALPEVSLATAEKVLRDIARRNKTTIRKRRSATLKEHLGNGYAVIDPCRNFILSGGMTQDGCDLDLAGLAQWFKDDKKNTPWQRTVINAIAKGRVKD